MFQAIQDIFSIYISPLTNKKVIITIFILGSIVYFNALFNGFVWDDKDQIVNNQVVQSLSNLPAFFTGGTFNGTYGTTIFKSYYRPIMSFCFSLLYTAFGPQPFPFHVFQVLLFIVNSVLVYFLLKNFLQKSLALLLSLIFLIHPINQEPAAYISAMQDTLFFFFGMLSFLLMQKGIKGIKEILIVNILLILSFLSKETGLAFVPVMIIYYLLFNKKHSLVFIVSTLLTSLAFLFFRFNILHIKVNPGPFVPISILPFAQRLITIPAIISYYIRTFFFPFPLGVDQQWVVKQMTISTFYLPFIFDIIFFGLLILLGYFSARKNKDNIIKYLFFLFWFLCGLLLHLQFFPLDMTVADRWFYFPMVGLLGVIGLGLSNLRIKNLKVKQVIIFIGIVLFSVFAIRTIIRNSNWQDNISLFSHDVNISTSSARLSYSLGLEYLRTQQFNDAKTQFEHVAELVPSNGKNWFELGYTYENLQEIEKARGAYIKSLETTQDFGAYQRLVPIYLVYDNNPQKAVKLIGEGLKHYPNNPLLLSYFSMAEYRVGNSQMALEIAKKLDSIQPSTTSKNLIYVITNNLPMNLQ